MNNARVGSVALAAIFAAHAATAHEEGEPHTEHAERAQLRLGAGPVYLTSALPARRR